MEKEELKEKIIAESTKLFLSYGVKSVTMDDIAKHLSMSKKTIYQFFKDKEEVVLLATQAHFEKEKEEMSAANDGSGNAIEHIYKLSLCLREKFKNLNLNVLYDLEKYYPKAWEIYTQYKNEVFYNSLLTTLTDGVQQGYFREDIKPEILAKLRMEEMQLSFDQKVFPREKYQVAEIQEQLFSHFIHGILSDKGTSLLNQYHQNSLINE